MKIFMDAINGFLYAFKTERNISIHLTIASSALVYLMFIRAEIYSFVIAYIAIFAVISSELMNTALERLCDFVEPENNEKIRQIKDISASSVFLNVVFSILMGYVILLIANSS